MNDYVRGALEALAWIQSLMEEMGKEKDWRKLKHSVDEAKEAILKGVAVDFLFRLQKGV